MSKLALFVLLAVFRLGCSSCTINPSEKPLINVPIQLIKTVPNGQALLIGSQDDPEQNFIYVAKLKGTPYQMGKAFGQLYASQLKQQLKAFYKYYDDYLQEVMRQKKLPAFLKNILVAETPRGLESVLDLNVLITKKYTNARYFEQIKGIGDGAQIDRREVLRLNVFPELIKAACTVAGIWKGAALNNHTLHMRALDWDSANPINKYPLITVYHPSTKGLQKHANIAWIGFVGSLTGISPKITLGQKVWLPPKNSVKMTRFGNPWTYVFRDLLYEATDMASALSILTRTHRTCAIHIGIGSTEDHSFRMLEYSYQTLNNYDDKNYTHYNANSHPQKDGIAYFDKHVQPSEDPCVGQLLTNANFYGKWTMESFWRVVGNSHKTGNTQLVVFDLEDQKGIISYSRNADKKTEDAFARSPILVDFNSLWADFS